MTSARELSLKYASMSPEQTCEYLQTHIVNGLPDDEITLRTVKYGTNELIMEQNESLIQKFFDQFQDPLIMLLLGSAILSLIVGQISDAVSITLTIIIVLSVAFAQEYQAQQSLDALNKLAPPYCHVVRNGHTSEILASSLVCGDIVRFSRGDRIPADCRILSAVELDVDESNLTGENEPTRKSVEVINSYSADVGFAERKNIAFMGTLIRNGHGTAVVYGIGNNTELGHVLKMLNDIEKPKTPLQNQMDELGKTLSGASFAFIGVIVLLGIWQGRPLLQIFTIAVSLAVAAIPEGLPVVVAVTLALGVLRMTSRNAIVKKLPSVESLGSVNVLCIDKTGTLTTNKMILNKIIPASNLIALDVEQRIDVSQLQDPCVKMLLTVGSLCNNSFLDQEGNINGQPTEVAIMEFFKQYGVVDDRNYYERISEVPFSPEYKWMGVECVQMGSSGSTTHFVKGAVNVILEKCQYLYVSENNFVPLTLNAKEKYLKYEEEVSSLGLRVLAFAFGTNPTELAFAGYLAMYDPPRIETAATIEELITFGTAKAIAKQVGIPTTSCYSGKQLDELSSTDWIHVVQTANVFYRTTPSHKLSIVKSLQGNLSFIKQVASGHIVAMTGDGVNDAPALRIADIGISLGNGTDVAKEAADMILVDDHLDIICDGPVAQSLGVEPMDPAVSSKPPRKKDESIITKTLIIRVIAMAMIIVIGTLRVSIVELDDGETTDRGRTMKPGQFLPLDSFQTKCSTLLLD
ncbi:High affinity Ca2+/Mn2+ P-type ATPase-like protein [Globomyces sp. JEL0801]|nr:High affinity Ca2+/Mn2+ P-type ATPase-like protein [Globomyces sp. JEL0801]